MTVKTYRIAVMAEGAFDIKSAKTASGVIRYSPHKVVAVIDSHNAGKKVQDVFGFGGDIPIVSSVEEIMPYQPEVLLIGIAPSGGKLPEEWRSTILDAISQRLEIWSGLHAFLNDDEEFVEMATLKNVRLWDVRQPPPQLTVATAQALNTRAYVVLMIGSDCNVGKMTTALELQKFSASQGYKAGFVATGQTGILIEGEGTPLDAVPGDFMAGEVEKLVMKLDQEGCDVIFVEGQGALLHPGYGPVTLGLLLGSMPDGYILVHQPSRKNFRPECDINLPPLPYIVRHYEDFMEYYKAPKVIAVSLNTSDLTADDAQAALESTARQIQLPTVDPIRSGVKALFEALEPHIKAKQAKSTVAI